MSKIEPLLAARQAADPSFQYAQDLQTGKFYLLNQVIFSFDPVDAGKTAEIEETIQAYVDGTNYIFAQQGKPEPIDSYEISIRSSGTVVVSGANTSSIIKIEGGGPNDPRPDPTPVNPGNVRHDTLMLVVAIQDYFNTIKTVLPESQLIL